MKNRSKKKILVLGASGGCGSWFVRLAVERGYDVSVVIRENAKFNEIQGVTIHYGDVLSPDLLDKALTGQDIVVSCLGLRRKNPRNPWSPLLSPPDLTSRVVRTIVPLLKKHKIKRFMVISAAGVAESFARLSWPIQRLVTSGNISVAYQDLKIMESVLAESDLDWTAVRPVTLTNGRPAGLAGEVEKYGLLSRIRRSDVAAWMLDTLEAPISLKDRKVMIGTPRR